MAGGGADQAEHVVRASHVHAGLACHDLSVWDTEASEGPSCGHVQEKHVQARVDLSSLGAGAGGPLHAVFQGIIHLRLT